ncbi:MAG: MerR family transcriptional regulator [Prevotella sp.]|jgi:DNA-binding transcriptional MerR regulator
MALATDKKVRLYYSIKEVAKMFNINESTLRYWETEFPQLKPRTQAVTKIRQYTEQDIEQVRLIYNLVKVRGFKIAAARKMLRENREGAEKSSEVITRLMDVRNQLQDLQKSLNALQ